MSTRRLFFCRSKVRRVFQFRHLSISTAQSVSTSRYVVAPPPTIPTIPVYGVSDKVFPVHRIYCVGRNYAEHTKEMGGDPTREEPFFFLKPADAIVPCTATTTSTTPPVSSVAQTGSTTTTTTTLPVVTTIPYASATMNLQYEVELVVALASSNIVYGYAVGVDLTRRDVQAQAKTQSRPWCSAKGFDRSAPISAIRPIQQANDLRVTDDPQHNRQNHHCYPVDAEASLWLQVNGTERQRVTPLRHMIWSVEEIMSSLAKQFELTAGDLIFTGTPAGVGPLVVGDKVVAGMDGVGELSFCIIESSNN